mgnify:CR=1 FL=1
MTDEGIYGAEMPRSVQLEKFQGSHPNLRMQLLCSYEARRGSQANPNITSKSVLRLPGRSNCGMVRCNGWDRKTLQSWSAKTTYSRLTLVPIVSRSAGTRQ